MSRSRIFLCVLLAFVGGVAIQSFVSVPVLFVWIGFLISCCLFAFWVTKRERRVLICGLCAAAFLSGILRFAYVENARPDLSQWYGQELALRGFVERDPEKTSKVQRARLGITHLENRPLDQPFSVLATMEQYPEYRIGDELEIRGVLERPENFTDDFDYVSYLARENIFATMFFPKAEKTAETKGSALFRGLARVKRSFEANIDAVLSEPHAAFLKGLLLGERESLPDDLVENFARTGTSHIIALSGYNITLVGRFFMGILLALTVHFYVAGWIAIASIMLFVFLVGASASVVRAGIMGILLLIAQREGRTYQMTNALAFAAALMVFQNPLILRFDAAFQLSFLATAGMVYLSPHVERFMNRAHDAAKKVFSRAVGQKKTKSEIFNPDDSARLFPVRRILIETLSAQIAVLPLLVYLFGRVSLVSPLANVLVLAAVPYSMGVGFLAGVGEFVWHPAGRALGWIAWLLLEYIIRVIKFFAQFPFALVSLPVVSPFFVFVVYACAAFFLTRSAKRA